MAKVTSKLQVTVPKTIADQYGLAPGDEVEFQPAGELIRLIPHGRTPHRLTTDQRLRLFDEATARQQRRDETRTPEPEPLNRGWSREDLYDRGRPG